MEYTLNQVSKLTGLTKRNVQYFTQTCLVQYSDYSPTTGRGVHRQYSKRHVCELTLIKELHSLGLGLISIEQILTCLLIDAALEMTLEERDKKYSSILDINNNKLEYFYIFCVPISKRGGYTVKIYEDKIDKLDIKEILNPLTDDELKYSNMFTDHVKNEYEKLGKKSKSNIKSPKHTANSFIFIDLIKTLKSIPWADV